MKRKSIVSLILAAIVIFSISIISCGNASKTRGNNFFNNNTTGARDNTGNNIVNTPESNMGRGVNNASDATKNRIDTSVDSIKYGAANFKNDIANAGYKLTDSTNNKRDYFKGAETDYLLGGDVVRLYEYNSPAELDGDVNKISTNGMTINGTDANFATKPYYYRKGNSLIVYEGKEPAYLDEFGRMFGNSLRPWF